MFIIVGPYLNLNIKDKSQMGCVNLDEAKSALSDSKLYRM